MHKCFLMMTTVVFSNFQLAGSGPVNPKKMYFYAKFFPIVSVDGTLNFKKWVGEGRHEFCQIFCF